MNENKTEIKKLNIVFGKTHEGIINDAVEIACSLGYTHVEREYGFTINDKNIVVDVFGRKPSGETIAFECGDLSGYNDQDRCKRLMLLSIMVDKCIWMPYCYSRMPTYVMNEQVETLELMQREKWQLEREIVILNKKHEQLKKRSGDIMYHLNGLMNCIEVENDGSVSD